MKQHAPASSETENFWFVSTCLFSARLTKAADFPNE